MKMKHFAKECPKNFTGIIEFSDGTQYDHSISICYFKDSILHREDGPAIIWINDVCWALNGKKFYSENGWIKQKLGI
jgi:hypothetical protein